MRETTKLFGSIKITKLAIKMVKMYQTTEVVLIHCNIVNNEYQQDSRVFYTFVPNLNLLVNYVFHPKKLYFYKLLIKNFHISKYGLLIKILNRLRQKENKHPFVIIKA